MAVQVLLASRFPGQILWGKDYVLLYNDAYRQILGSKHPQNLGQTGRECWQEVWDFAYPLLEQVRTTGEALSSDHQRLLIERSGYLEECYFSFCYTPILDESGQVGGIFNQVYETTDQVLRERRQQLQNQVAIQVAIAKTPEADYQLAAESLTDAIDVPFALFYQFDAQAARADLMSDVGKIRDRSELRSFNLADHGNQLKDALAKVFQTKQSITIEQVDLEQLPIERYGDPFRQMLIQPIIVPGQDHALGCLVAGLNPHRSLDSAYHYLFEPITQHLGICN